MRASTLALPWPGCAALAGEGGFGLPLSEHASLELSRTENTLLSHTLL